MCPNNEINTNSNYNHEVMEDINEKIIQGLQRISMVIRHLLWKVSQEHGLSPLQIQVLLMGTEQKRRSLGEYASLLRVKQSTLSDAIQVLETKGYLRRVPEKSNRRVRYLRITPRGKKLVETLRDWHSELITALEKVSPEVKEGGWYFLLNLISQLVQGGVVQEARMCFLCKYFVVRNEEEGRFWCDYLKEDLPLHMLRLDCPDYVAALITVGNR